MTHTFAASFSSRGDLQALQSALRHKAFTAGTRALLEERMALPPRIRLTVNLKSFLSCAVRREIEHVEDGLVPAERRALDEIDRADLPLPLKETAHGVLDVHWRWVMMKSVGRAYREARSADRNVLAQFSPLGEILGGPEDGQGASDD